MIWHNGKLFCVINLLFWIIIINIITADEWEKIGYASS